MGNCSSGRVNLWINLWMQRFLAALLCHRGQLGHGIAAAWVELGKVGQLRLPPIFYLHPVPRLFPQHSLTSAHCTGSLSARSCEPLICLYTRDRATECSHLEPPACAFQLSDHPRAAISTCLCAEAAAPDLTPRYLCVWSCDELNSAVTTEKVPLLFSSGIFSFCALVSLLLPPEKQPGAALHRSGEDFFPPAFLLLQLERCQLPRRNNPQGA